MADSKAKRGKADRARVSTSEPYEMRYFARKHGLTAEQALKIVKASGSSRTKANAAAERFKKRA